MTTISTQAELDAAAPAILSAPCETCEGTGRLPCEMCGGTGHVDHHSGDGIHTCPNRFNDPDKPAYDTGVCDTEECPDCDGTGVPRVRELRLSPTEPLGVRRWLERDCEACGGHGSDDLNCPCEDCRGSGLEMTFRRVVVAGQVGPDARPLHPAWVREIIRQCEAAGVEVVFSSWGEWAPREVLTRGLDEASGLDAIRWWSKHDGWVSGITSEQGVQYMVRVGPERSGRTLDGREWRVSE